jgi:hypothetical protein
LSCEKKRPESFESEKHRQHEIFDFGTGKKRAHKNLASTQPHTRYCSIQDPRISTTYTPTMTTRQQQVQHATMSGIISSCSSSSSDEYEEEESTPPVFVGSSSVAADEDEMLIDLSSSSTSPSSHHLRYPHHVSSSSSYAGAEESYEYESSGAGAAGSAGSAGCAYRDFFYKEASEIQATYIEPPKAKRRGPRGGVTVPFPVRLYDMLQSVEEAQQQDMDDIPTGQGQGRRLKDIVSWLPHGRSFIVHQPDTFVSEIMPK